VAIEVTTNIDYLIDDLRLHLGDYIEPYSYATEWLRTALIGGIKSLIPWWDSRYTVGADYNVVRSTNYNFEFATPPIIQQSDEKPVILMASLIMKGGSLENSSWSLGSWRDSEVSYSNIEGGKTKRESYKADWDALTEILKPPQKRLQDPFKSSLPGFKDNPFEYKN
jgi:hypothetical protein